MKKLLLSIIGGAMLSTSVHAQQHAFDTSNARDGESVEYCITHKKRKELLSNPDYIKALAQDEIIREQEAQNSSNIQKAPVYYIPIVFHIIHSGGSENISDAQIFDAVDILNVDFRKLNADAGTVHADFQGLPADSEIEFRLATKAPNGTCFTGITRTQSSLTNDGGNGTAQVTAVKNGNDVYNGDWSSDEYLNIYVIADAGGAAGYTRNPSVFTQVNMYDGIWILHSYVGSIGTGSTNASRALTHEIGHWLNLSHTWGPNNNPGNTASCGDDDGVNDTPNTIGVTGCFLNENTCGPRANVENYMDYSYCSKMFTPGQVTRMRDALTSSIAGRNNLWKQTNLDNTGANGVLALCKAQFSANKSSVCGGTQIQFTDESYNSATGWNWTFENGSPGTSTAQNPIVTYTTEGYHKVTLEVTDGVTTKTEIKNDFIHVVPAALSIPLAEGFESYSTLNNLEEWGVINPIGNGFELATTGLNSSKSAKLMNYGQSAGDVDELISSPVDLSGISQVTLSFRYAHKRRNSSDDDKLRLYITKNCGDAWAVRKTILMSIASPVQSSSFTPSSESDWTTVHVTNITSSYLVDNFRYKFTFEGGGGNNIYLDNINIYEGGTAGITENNSVNGLSIYPNPVEEELSVDFTIANAQQVMLTVQDVTGKIAQQHVVNANEGSNVVLMDTQNLSSGVYFIEVTSGGTRQVKQFIVK